MLFLFIGMVGLGIVNQKRQVKGAANELNLAITQAQTIRKDLVQLMEDALDLSRTLVNDIDHKINEANQIDINVEKPIQDTAIDELADVDYDDKIVELSIAGKDSDRIRVYELARMLNTTSRALILALRESGWNIKSHMSSLSEDQVRLVNQKFNSIQINTQEKDIKEISYNNNVNVMESELDDQLLDDQYDAFINNLKTAHPYLAVRTLYEKGFSIREIAQLLGRGQGEIDLILNLSRKKQAL